MILSFRTNSNGQVYPVDNKNILKFDPKSKTFNMFSNNSNELDNQKRKHLEKFADMTKKGIFGASDLIKQKHQETKEAIKLKNQERVGQKESNHKEVNVRINSIMSSGEPPYMMIQHLQRLLNDKSKHMDKPMLQTIQNELTKLHEINGTNDNEEEFDKDGFDKNGNYADEYNQNDKNDNESDDTNEYKIKGKHMTPNEVFSQGL